MIKLSQVVEEELNIDDVIYLYEKAKKALMKEGIYQWNGVYPNQETFINAVKKNEFFYILDEDIQIGAVILNRWQDEEWSKVSWEYSGDSCLVIHALVIDPNYQGKGYGRQSLHLMEAFAKENGYKSIRFDAFSENKIATGLYEKLGYSKVGEVSFAYKPKGHQLYFCYEKEVSRE